MAKERLWTPSFISICICSFFVFITFYSLSSVLPSFVMDHLEGTKQQGGLVLTFFVIAAVLVRPFSGRWLDSLGRRPILLAALALFVLASFLYILVGGMFGLLALRFLHGLSFGVATTATGAIATDRIPEGRKGEGMGYFTMSMNLAMVLGPFFGLTVIESHSFHLLFLILAVFAGLSLIFGWITFAGAAVASTGTAPAAAAAAAAAATATAKTVKQRDTATEANPPAAPWWHAFLELGAVRISIVGLFASIAYSGILTFIPSYAKERGMSGYASEFFVVYAAMILLSRPFTGRAFDRFGQSVVVYPSVLLYAVGLSLLASAHSPVLLFAAAAVIGLGFGTLSPSFQTIAVLRSAPGRRGTATATFLLFFDMGVGIGSVLLGQLASQFGYTGMFVASSLLVLLCGLLYGLIYHLPQRKAKPVVLLTLEQE